jgi:hypothetical protein
MKGIKDDDMFRVFGLNKWKHRVAAFREEEGCW